MITCHVLRDDWLVSFSGCGWVCWVVVQKLVCVLGLVRESVCVNVCVSDNLPGDNR